VPAQPYDELFYRNHRDRSLRSAREIVPVVLEFVRPRRVVDVGCGVGQWLSVFSELGVPEVLGVDGDYVRREMLLIPRERFLARDLTKPLGVEGRFDLAVSLEVAEHLHEEHAANFVAALVALAPLVLFSAAVPLQGGTHHVNEQWPDYWARHFARHGYLPVDCIRPRVWESDAVETWYAQNTLMYASAEYIDANPALKAEREKTTGRPLNIVHPKNYLHRSLYLDGQELSLRQVAGLLPGLARNAFARRLKRASGQAHAVAQGVKPHE
jgi:SAM-dependent methyltransferase